MGEEPAVLGLQFMLCTFCKKTVSSSNPSLQSRLASHSRRQTLLLGCRRLSICSRWAWILVGRPGEGTSLALVFTLTQALFAVQWENEKEGTGVRQEGGRESGENGYLYLLAPQLRSHIPGGFLTQCSTNWCSWRSDRVIRSLAEGDVPHLSAQKKGVLIEDGTAGGYFNSTCVWLQRPLFEKNEIK